MNKKYQNFKASIQITTILVLLGTINPIFAKSTIMTPQEAALNISISKLDDSFVDDAFLIECSANSEIVNLSLYIDDYLYQTVSENSLNCTITAYDFDVGYDGSPGDTKFELIGYDAEGNQYSVQEWQQLMNFWLLIGVFGILPVSAIILILVIVKIQKKKKQKNRKPITIADVSLDIIK